MAHKLELIVENYQDISVILETIEHSIDLISWNYEEGE